MQFGLQPLKDWVSKECVFVSALLVSDSNAAMIQDLARGGELELLVFPGIQFFPPS